jgi:hypothetical protein
MKKLVILVLLLCWKISALAAFPALEYSVPFDLGGYTYTDYVILKIENSSTYDYAVVYYANHQSVYSTTECNKDLSCAQSACYGAFGYASYPDNRGTSGYLLQYNDWCGYIPHFSRKHDKTTGVWSDSGFENQNETLRVDPTLPLSQSTITTFPLSLFNYHPANDDFLGDYGLDVVTFGMVVLEANVSYFVIKLPLAGGKNWLLTTQNGGNIFCSGGMDSYHTGSGYYSLDFDDYNSADGHITDSPIYAVASGTVDTGDYGYDASSYGHWVRINHGNGYKTLYAHMAAQSLITSGTVNQGDHLGTVGSTGNSSGTHLHFQVYYNGSSANTVTQLGLVQMEGLHLYEYVVGCNTYYPSTNTP